MAEINLYPYLYNEQEQQQQFTLNKINEIKDCLIAEIKEIELMSKKLSKYIVFFFIILTSHYLFYQ